MLQAGQMPRSFTGSSGHFRCQWLTVTKNWTVLPKLGFCLIVNRIIVGTCLLVLAYLYKWRYFFVKCLFLVRLTLSKLVLTNENTVCACLLEQPPPPPPTPELIPTLKFPNTWSATVFTIVLTSSGFTDDKIFSAVWSSGWETSAVWAVSKTK